MRCSSRPSRSFLIASPAALATTFFLAAPARAQVDTNPPLPNVLLLVDNSGSMEYMAAPDGTTGASRLPVCTPGQPSQTNEQNRWGSLLSVLTGEIQGFSCYAQPRATTAFQNEYRLGTFAPYDKDYYLPFHRAVSGGCVFGPNSAAWPPAGANGVYQFPATVMKTHAYDDPTRSCSGFAQSEDGLLDAFRRQARFGLMTFDSSPTPETGLTAAAAADYPAGMAGLWSYYPNWQSGSVAQAAKGRPEQCITDQSLEVGARNPAAPPWEGRLIGFGDPAASDAENSLQNDRIQNALLLLRPYGATPTAGLLQDASYFFQNDPSADPLDPTNAQKHFGPKEDPFVNGGCRRSYIVLLTDGQPNLDLRPGCGSNPPTPDGTCPYRTTTEIAYELAHPSDPRKAVRTFVVGFAVSTVGPAGPTRVDCSELTPTGSTAFDPSGRCANPNTNTLKTCCELGRVAFAGGTTNPRFADDKDKLRQALNDILAEISASSTSRTTPVFSVPTSATTVSMKNSNAPGVAFNVYSSFFVSTGALWSGVLERQRYTCEKDVNTGIYQSKLETIDATKGDSFSRNVNAQDAQRPRQFYSVNPSSSSPLPGSALLASRTLRPTTINDGLGSISLTSVNGTSANFVTQVSPATLAVTTGTGSTCNSAKEPLVPPTTCRDRILGWEVGLPVSLPNNITYSRAGNVFGSIYHSTPTIVPPPSDYLRDESYNTFQEQQKNRPLVLYTATTDGQLHAFKVAGATAADTFKVDALQNNELWSFLPPGVLPKLRTLYPGVQQNVLDGVPVVQDVVLNRTSNTAQTATVRWSTALVAGFGPSLGGYYAVDVTKPVPVAGDSTTGPQFRWQVSTDESGNPLFGPSSTPAIASVFVVPPGQTAAEEIAVALLPGGSGSPSNGAACGRTQPNPTQVDPNWTARASVPCYADSDPSRSLTVVRLDTGEVIRTFRRSTTGISTTLASRTTVAPFDSPVMGVPVTYPTGTGVVANRAYIGDRDGTIWRLDMRSTNPAAWTVSMFFDTYAGLGATEGQPLVTQPVLSVDSLGNLVLLVSTGDQEQFAATSGLRNLVWSLREEPVAGSTLLRSRANWHLGRGTNETIPNLPTNASTNWTGGERVAGPMSIFNGVVYFSSFRPAPSTQQSCAAGQSTLWGVDYLQSTGGTSDAAPKGRLVLNTTTDPANAPPAQVQPDGGVIFGVGLTRTPACYDTTTYSDPYLGYGTATSIANLNPGNFQLVVQTGNQGTAPTGGLTNTKTFNLPTPPPTVRIDSWAAVVE